jgi:hypothetical protein
MIGRILSTLEDGFAAQKLRENAANGPDVDSGSLRCHVMLKDPSAKMMKEAHVVGETEHDFRRSVPSGRHVFRHEALVAGGLGGSASRGVPSGEPKITDLELAVRIDQEISRLEIPMEDVGRMDIFQAAESLIKERLEVRVRERLSRSDLEER